MVCESLVLSGISKPEAQSTKKMEESVWIINVLATFTQAAKQDSEICLKPKQ